MNAQHGFELNFDQWAEIARTDPSRFEQMRLAAIEQCIGNAPPAQQQRLRRLQWRIDQERRRASNPLAACIRVSRMMWQSLLGQGGLCERLNTLGGLARGAAEPPAPASATVLAFARGGRR